ncbi:MAG: hypothetical protein FJ087_01555 [Deltaproteobacteria bacterium]|nr:hypothetical protein [Deltaproteobacteria bacterium]
MRGDLLIMEQLGMPLEKIDQLTDDEWHLALAQACWLERRKVRRLRDAVALGIVKAFTGKE